MPARVGWSAIVDASVWRFRMVKAAKTRHGTGFVGSRPLSAASEVYFAAVADAMVATFEPASANSFASAAN